MSRRLTTVVACALFSVGMSYGQVPNPALDTIAIVNAKIVVGNGTVIERGTVVTRNGLIEAVGAGVSAPKGAEVVDGSGLVVYPGFIDMATTKGLDALPDRPKQITELNPSSDVPTAFRSSFASARADAMAANLFKSDDATWQGYRSAGFTSAVMYPPAGVIKGMAALANLGLGGRTDNIVKSRAGLAVRLNSPGGGGYPDSMLGAFAVARQVFLDAERAIRAQQQFESGSSSRGPNDSNYDALAPVLRRDVPVLFEADEESQIDRALSFAKEMGLRPIIVGAGRAYKVLGHEPMPLEAIVGLRFGTEPMKAPSEAKGEKKEEEAPKTPGPDDEPAERVKERQRIFEDTASNAGKLEKAGVLFAFTTAGNDGISEFMGNLRRAVKAGLTPEGALKGLTINAATLLGLQKQLGTVEAGKIANLTVLNGDFLDEKSKLKFVVIDGNKIDPSRTDRRQVRRRFGDIE